MEPAADLKDVEEEAKWKPPDGQVKLYILDRFKPRFVEYSVPEDPVTVVRRAPVEHWHRQWVLVEENIE